MKKKLKVAYSLTTIMAYTDSNLKFAVKILILFGIMLLGLINPNKLNTRNQLSDATKLSLEYLFDKANHAPFVFKKIIMK